MNETHSPLTSGELLAIFILLLLLLLGCSATPQAESAAPGTPSTVAQSTPTIDQPSAPAVLASAIDWSSTAALPFDEAILNSLGSLLSMIELPSPGEKQILLVEPVIDGRSGVQSIATRRVEAKLADLARRKYPYLALRPTSPFQLEKLPVVLIGTLTAVDAAGYPEGKREAYRLCLALADLKSSRFVSKESAKIQIKGVDHVPTRYFIESPAWFAEESSELHTVCEASRVGASLPRQLSESMARRALINEAIAHYESGHYQKALDRYTSAAASAAANDLQIRNGLYLANLRLGRNDAATQAFDKIIELGMARDQLALKFPFKAGSAVFPPDTRMYSGWLREIARRAKQVDGCLEVVGHASPSGPEPMNVRLSVERADYIKKLLETEFGSPAGRITARGVGSRENLVGTGKDDLSDSLDRRIAFRLIPCPGTATRTAHR